MNIEENLSQTNLEVLSNFLIKFREAKQQENIENYVIRYNGAKNNGISNVDMYFSSTYTENTNQYVLQNIYQCRFKLNEFTDQGTNEPISWENFNYQEKINSCNYGGTYELLKNYSDNTSTSRYMASNLYNENYLDYNKYKTIEIEPSPSPEPETPTTNGFDSINPYFWILPSFILMLMFMYKFLDKIFSTGK